MGLWQGAFVVAGMADVVVVGASLAGLRAVETLRNEGYEGRVTLIGAEHHLPYDRPPLSKKVLAGEWEPDRIALRRDGDLGSLDVVAHLGREASALDVGRQVVTLLDGEEVPYDGLVIATGATVRRLPDQPELEGVHVLRTLDDSLALRAALTSGAPHVVVVGAGFIGSEVAATARGLGCDVTILEALPVPLERALGPRMGHACAALHGDHGVDLRVGVGVAGLEGASGRVEAVRLTDGTRVAADVVVVGVGVAPATGWLEESGLTLRDGVVCDPTLAAGPPGVYAAGDICRWTNRLFAEEMRVEHWTNAAEQGAHAARSLLATATGQEAEPYAPVPFFWSDQYGQRIQFLGRAGPDDEVRVVSGSVEERGFVALYGRAGRLRGVLGLSCPKLVMPYQKLLASGITWDDALGHAAAIG
jgi:NADPH-dependent 2,4-dienoyl-CoA reductase/sulfur reductase-like enzyme